MAPNVTTALTALCEEDLAKSPPSKPLYKRKIVWFNVYAFCVLHATALYGMYLAFTSAKLITTFYAFILYQCGGIGITAGAHRLWSHRAYKAKMPLKIILLIFNTLAFQNSIYEWARDHRVHHKYSETDADPHNANRGFFFAHVGWLLCKKHPDVKEKGKGIDMSDLEADPVVAFQHKYYLILMPLICFILPGIAPVYFWGESWSNAYFVGVFLRYVWTLHMTWLVNSAAHFFGHRPYDKYTNPSENILVAFGALGEGFHDYHHVFPWDYKAAELGKYWGNSTTAFIDFFTVLGWAYDTKVVSQDIIKQRVLRTGDGSHPVWGWGDKDQTADNRESAVTTNKLHTQ
ncbi:acyl-CoA Delta-9 desaturase-like [Cotesia glomerata]|uniref:Fatty acid desaturase domain-containing protein n=1 Tax=Cotesia glomerata TaxID=32391 RepID=A0AAV7IUR7_COTGL|nr:acyl-CoA Delta-9 desaturase-like [Cotesia glomerata]KAH0568594.1 hypothetical protein KQX54_021268 [Cotesia glomerata]